MTAPRVSSDPLPAGFDTWPTLTPTARELADLDMLLSGGFRPLDGLPGRADLAAVRGAGRLVDGRPWPAEVTLTAAEALAGPVVVQDAEGSPVAVVDVQESWPVGADSAAGRWFLAGPVRPLRAHGPYRRLRRSADQTRAALPGGPVLGVVTDRPLHRHALQRVASAAGALDGAVLVLVRMGEPAPDRLPPEQLIRAVLAARPELPATTLVVPVPLAARADPVRDELLAGHVAANFGATHLLGPAAAGGPLPVVTPPVDRPELSDGELARLLDAGGPLPDWFTSPAVARVLRAWRPPRRRRGVTVLFTGLSGSGKSTLARGVHDALGERLDRPATLLDGDVVRRLLSAGLTFSRADRDLNVRRIGYVAAEVTRHGGIALCAPIAPYAATRADVRRMVSAVGDFVLVHVATPLAVCESRDHKGLYAKARAGVVPSFTGISDPYETPADADLVLDMSVLSPEEGVDRVVDFLVAGGWIAGTR